MIMSKAHVLSLKKICTDPMFAQYRYCGILSGSTLHSPVPDYELSMQFTMGSFHQKYQENQDRSLETAINMQMSVQYIGSRISVVIPVVMISCISKRQMMRILIDTDIKQ